MSRKKRPSWIFSASIPTNTPWSRLSKNWLRSPSMNHLVPFHVRCTSLRAVWHPRPRRKPWEWSENWGS